MVTNNWTVTPLYRGDKLPLVAVRPVYLASRSDVYRPGIPAYGDHRPAPIHCGKAHRKSMERGAQPSTIGEGSRPTFRTSRLTESENLRCKTRPHVKTCPLSIRSAVRQDKRPLPCFYLSLSQSAAASFLLCTVIGLVALVAMVGSRKSAAGSGQSQFTVKRFLCSVHRSVTTACSVVTRVKQSSRPGHHGFVQPTLNIRCDMTPRKHQ
jgi:hypothetical protein